MGINVDNFSILNGNVVLPTVYINIRNIQCNKLPFGTFNEGQYVISFECICNLNNTVVNTFDIRKEYSAPFTEDSWSKAYILLKEKMTTDGLTFTNSI